MIKQLENMSQNVLITSASAKVPLVRAVMAAQLKIGLKGKTWVGDTDDTAVTRYVADDFWLMPPLKELDLDAFVAGCHERHIGSVVPTRDGELEFWALNKDALQQQGITVVVSCLESVTRCLDKASFSLFGIKNRVPVIPSTLCIDDLPHESGTRTRYTVKERYGAGSRSIGLDLSRSAALEHAKTLDCPLFQPFVDGRELSVDAWMDATGHQKGLVMRWRNKVVNGESQITTTFRQPALENQLASVLSLLNLRGPVVLQALVDDKRQLHIIECNARFGGASTASIAVGLDSFYWSILETQGQCLSDFPFERSLAELRQIRIASDELIYDTGL